ncbi:unnamed protein product, partial [Nesidiocoris tenuis]
RGKWAIYPSALNKNRLTFASPVTERRALRIHGARLILIDPRSTDGLAVTATIRNNSSRIYRLVRPICHPFCNIAFRIRHRRRMVRGWERKERRRIGRRRMMRRWRRMMRRWRRRK